MHHSSPVVVPVTVVKNGLDGTSCDALLLQCLQCAHTPCSEVNIIFMPGWQAACMTGFACNQQDQQDCVRSHQAYLYCLTAGAHLFAGVSSVVTSS
jgi:hypothetical protein